MTDEQPTMEELRAKIGSQRAWLGKYADRPGAGPAGKTCHDCGWLHYTGLAKPTKYPKCGKTNYTSGDATTIKTRTAACSHFEQYVAGQPSLTYARRKALDAKERTP
jgi:hypothetical protein